MELDSVNANRFLLLLLLLLSHFSPVWLCATHRRQPNRLPRPWDSPGKDTGVGCRFLLQCLKVKSESKSLSCVRPSAIPWTTAFQAPPSMGFSRQEYWSGVPLPQFSLKSPCVPTVLSSLPPTPGRHWSFYRLHGFVFSGMLQSWNHTLFRQASFT